MSTSSSSTTSVLYAAPYDREKPGFFFSSTKEFKAQSALNPEVEEYEIEFVEGPGSARVFYACNPAPTDEFLDLWFDDLEDVDEEEALLYLLQEKAKPIDEALDLLNVGQVSIYRGSAGDYAEEFIDGSYGSEFLPEHLQAYFDYEAYGRDLELGGDIVEIGNNLYVTNPNDLD